MKKLLRPGDVLLFGLAGAVDIYEEIRDPFGVAAYGAKALYGWVPRRFKRHNLSRVVANRIKTGEIERVIKDGEAYLRLTSAGEEKIKRDFPMTALSGGKWDGKWRVVIFDISETNRNTRDLFRLKLKEMGFGMLQESVWVSPHDITADLQEFLEEKKLDPLVFILEVSSLLVGNKDFLINRIWHLDDLNDQYKELIREQEKINRMYVSLHDRDKKPTSEKDREKGLREKDQKIRKKVQEGIIRLRQKYLQLILADPCLPRELLPEGWAREKARKAVRAL